ncbi:MAG: 4-hydroxy-tetrahydrodipicolinate synthase [Clostridia bacterium]|nr:4-hydroxy-tetrahydrodipicolinate synthase [Clostridia bacterium]
MVFEGSAVALITPFYKNGQVNYYTLKELIEFQIANNTKAIVILGTTGEASTITFEEREKIIKFSASIINKRVPLIVGTGSNDTKRAIFLTKQAEKLGADTALVVTPFYNKCNQEGLFIHYKRVAESVKIPIILYNVPSRTGVNILPETVLKLSKIKNISGIKEASGNFCQISKLINILPKNFAVYSGDDSLNLPIYALGGKGTISVTANCYPEKVSLLYYYASINDYGNARLISDFLFKINEALFYDVNPICVKHYLSLMSFNVGAPRLPLSQANDSIKKKLLEVFKFYEN